MAALFFSQLRLDILNIDGGEDMEIVETQEQITARIVAAAVTAAAIATAKQVNESAVAAAIVVAKDSNAANTSFGVLDYKIGVIQDQQKLFENTVNVRMDKQEDDSKANFKEVFTLLRKLAEGRPSWLVTFILGALMSISTGLAIFIIVTK
jgi:hypothetical protein